MTAIALNGFYDWVTNHLLSCPFKQTFGIDCPGCGLQRSLIYLMQGDFMASFKMYPPSVPILAIVFFLPFHLKYDFKNGALLIKVLYIIIALLILLNYIYKLYTHNLH
jgi:hypothetical protein